MRAAEIERVQPVCRLGWIPATVVIAALTLSTIYSGHLLLRLYNAVPNAVLFGDIGEAAAGNKVLTYVRTPNFQQHALCGNMAGLTLSVISSGHLL